MSRQVAQIETRFFVQLATIFVTIHLRTILKKFSFQIAFSKLAQTAMFSIVQIAEKNLFYAVCPIRDMGEEIPLYAHLKAQAAHPCGGGGLISQRQEWCLFLENAHEFCGADESLTVLPIGAGGLAPNLYALACRPAGKQQRRE